MIYKVPGIVICGTDTDIGKTVISSLLVQGLNATYWKPIQSGLDEGGDTGRVCKWLDLPKSRWIPEAYKFKAPVSPHWAAERENILIETERLKIPSIKNGPLIIETAGGVLVPLTRTWLQIDQLELWRLPIVLVAKSGLGTLNHTLLSLEALRRRNLTVIGIILNGPKHLDNPRTLEELGDVSVIAQLPILKEISAATLLHQWESQNLSKKFTELLS